MGLWETYGKHFQSENSHPKNTKIPKIPLPSPPKSNFSIFSIFSTKGNDLKTEQERAAKVARIGKEYRQWLDGCSGYYEGCFTCPDYIQGKDGFLYFCRKANMAIFGKPTVYVMVINDGSGAIAGQGNMDGKLTVNKGKARHTGAQGH